MAVDPKHGAGTSGSAEATPESDTARTRKFAASRRDAAPAVSAESKLDAFIAKANAELGQVDVTAFKPEHREEQLRRELDVLQTRVAAAEVRAVAAELRVAAAEARAASPSQRWGAVIVAFVIGGAAMFAVSLVLPRNGPSAAASVTAPTVAPPTVAGPTVTGPTVTPPTVTPIETYGAVVTDPVAAQEPAVAPPTAAPPISEKVTKKPAGKPVARPRPRGDAAPAPKPPEDDLYNPF